MNYNRPHVEDIRAKKQRGEKLSMLYVTSLKGRRGGCC